MGVVVTSPNAFPRLRGQDAQQSRVQDSVNATLQPIATALNATPIMGAPPPAWIPFDIQAGWSALGGGNAAPAFHKNALGYVFVKGAWLNTSGGPTTAVCGILPPGYRPAETNDFPVSVSGGNAQAIIITSDGKMTPDTNIPNNGHMHTSFCFLAER